MKILKKIKEDSILNITERCKTTEEIISSADKVIINAPYVINDELLSGDADIYIYATVNDTENQKYLEKYLFTNK